MIDLCSAVRILKQIVPKYSIESYISIIKMINNLVLEMEEEDLKHVPLGAIIDYLKLFSKSSYIDGMLKKFDEVICVLDYT